MGIRRVKKAERAETLELGLLEIGDTFCWEDDYGDKPTVCMVVDLSDFPMDEDYCDEHGETESVFCLDLADGCVFTADCDDSVIELDCELSVSRK